MLNSNRRKRILCGWLCKNYSDLYQSPLKLQKFLFFYECFCKVKGKLYDFSSLKGYIQGPVFSNVYGDYTKEQTEFCKSIMIFWKENAPQENVFCEIDLFTAKQCAFMCATMTEQELSDLTHVMNIWKKKEKKIKDGIKQVRLNDTDFTEKDTKLIMDLIDMYSSDLINNKKIINEGSKYFVLTDEDAKMLTTTHRNILRELADKYSDELLNPTIVEIDKETGGICILD